MSTKGDAPKIRESVESLVNQTTERLRSNLLDVTLRNPLLAFKHGARGKKCIRAIDEIPNELFRRLDEEQSSLTFRSLGDREGEPADERRIEFRRALDAAKLDDTEYLQSLRSAGSDPGDRVLDRLDRELRARVRKSLGLPERPDRTSADPAQVARRKNLDPSFDLPAAGAPNLSTLHSDTSIQTLMFTDQLETILNALRDEVRVSLDETGVNPLFVVFGFLEWFETDNSEQPLTAPLLMFPLELERELIRGVWEYRVKSSGEGAMVNVALSERLKRDFAIEIPPFGEDDTPESYWARVEIAVSKQKNWKVRRWITIGLFSFAKIAMYHDLDPTKWCGGTGLSKHPGMARLLAGGNGFGDTDIADSEPRAIYAGEDTRFHSAAEADQWEMSIPLVADADSSQLDAIRKVLAGQDLVIEGPPGTGKSQTITNIIAAAIAAGKTVLFVAEKMAALNVVKDRLEKLGLGEFCFELHSNKSGRRETFAAIDRRLKKTRPKPAQADWQSVNGDLKALRANLSSLVEALGEQAGNSGGTVHELLWRLQACRDAGEELASEINELWLEGAETMTDADLSRILASAQEYQKNRAAIVQDWGSIARNPWFGLARAGLDSLTSEKIVIRVGRLGAAAAQVAKSCEAVQGLTGWQPDSIEQLELLAPAFHLTPPGSACDDTLVARLLEHSLRMEATAFVENKNEHDSLFGELTSILAPSAGVAEPKALSAFSDTALRAFAPAMTLDGLKAEALTTNTSVKMLQTVTRHLAQLRALVNSGLAAMAEEPIVEDASVDRELLVACELASQASESVRRSRCPEYLAAGAIEVMTAALRERISLVTDRDRLAGTFVLEHCPKAAELWTHARAIRSASMLPWFSRAYREARAVWKMLRRKAIKISRGQMAEDLERIAGWRGRLEAFGSNAQFMQCFGDRFQGVNTDIETAIAAASWADAIRTQLSRESQETERLRQLLFQCPESTLKGMAAWASASDRLKIAQLIASEVSEGCTLSQAAAVKADLSTQQSRLCEVADKLGLRGHVRIEAIAGIAQRLARSRECCERLTVAPPIEQLLGDAFDGPRTNVQSLEHSISYVDAIESSRLPKSVRSWLGESQARDRFERFRRVVAGATEATAAFTAARVALEEAVQLKPEVWLASDSVPKAVPADIAAHCNSCHANPGALRMLVEDLAYAESLRKEGVGSILDLCDRGVLPIDRLGDAIRVTWLQSVARSVLARKPVLRGFSGTQFETERARFRQLDRRVQELQRGRIAETVLQRLIPPGSDRGPRTEWTDLALIKHVTGLQRPRTSIRHLMKKAAPAVKQLMPCFMMSPLSVAQYLPAEEMSFDLVVMDEASQLRPEDAVGAIARGKQVVIVGDPKQLPPTDFFARTSGEDPVGDQDPTAADEKSILDAAMPILSPVQRLKWHYRSRHGSLIAFSNKEFYDNELVIFPSPQQHHPEYGVQFVHVEEGCYRGQTNPNEAMRVAAAVFEHARKFPKRSLGVVALNMKQAELLRLEIDRLAAEDPMFETWRKKFDGTLEPFFVKNLENVQGDERDVMFISTVYGKNENGIVFQRFGPINAKGGHRRLNVLFTRAKRRMVVFSTMMPSDIRVDETSSWGVRALQGFLEFAKSRLLDTARITDREPDSDFERSVAAAIRDEGYEAVPQVGVVGYFIDIGIRHPKRVGEFMLGVECDGSTYHSTKSARDRDRLRQQQLEELGWSIHRIWSLDWFRDPKLERKKLREAMARAVERERPIG